MIKSSISRVVLARIAQSMLIIDGVLHFAEVTSAYYEGAYTTMLLTGLHSCVFLVGVYFIGHDLTHHDVEERMVLL